MDLHSCKLLLDILFDVRYYGCHCLQKLTLKKKQKQTKTKNCINKLSDDLFIAALILY